MRIMWIVWNGRRFNVVNLGDSLFMRTSLVGHNLNRGDSARFIFLFYGVTGAAADSDDDVWAHVVDILTTHIHKLYMSRYVI